MSNEKQEYYKIKVAGLERDLPICALNDKLSIAGFVMLGDYELTEACARELNKLLWIPVLRPLRMIFRGLF